MKLILNPRYESLRSFVLSLPVEFDKSGQTIHVGRNVLKIFNVGEFKLVVKKFKKPNAVNKLIYTHFRPSKAKRSYEYAYGIIERGFDSPDPVAYMEMYEAGLLTDSYYVCLHWAGDTVREIMMGDVKGNEEVLKVFSRYTAELHSAGILHVDYSPGNILFRRDGQFGSYSFSLVDINRLKFLSFIGMNEVCHNLRRLAISKSVLSYICREYASQRAWDVDLMEREASACSDAFFRKYMFRLARKHLGFLSSCKLIQFKLYRSIHASLPVIYTQSMNDKERAIYTRYIREYDFRKIFQSEYQLDK